MPGRDRPTQAKFCVGRFLFLIRLRRVSVPEVESARRVGTARVSEVGRFPFSVLLRGGQDGTSRVLFRFGDAVVVFVIELGRSLVVDHDVCKPVHLHH